MLPRPVAPITGQTLSSYLPRLARTNHLTLTEVLATLPSWFSTKINNPDELSQHHMLVPATTDALSRHTGPRTEIFLPRRRPISGKPVHPLTQQRSGVDMLTDQRADSAGVAMAYASAKPTVPPIPD
nr:hypothetical protein JVH1_0252 [Rhodococcus sp. JVH1]